MENDEPKTEDWTILQTLRASVIIQNNIQLLQTEAKCLEQTIGLPTTFEYPLEFEWFEMDKKKERFLTPTGSAINSLVLGDHIVIEDPFFKDVVLEQLGKVFSPHQIHVITDNLSVYATNYGSIHCSTNVIREP
jgi:hypothetical protein